MPTFYQIMKVANELPEALNKDRTKNPPSIVQVEYDDIANTREPVEFIVYEFTNQSDAGAFGLHYTQGRVHINDISSVKLTAAKDLARRDGKYIVILKADYVYEQGTLLLSAAQASATEPSKPATQTGSSAAVATTTATAEPLKPLRIKVSEQSKTYSLTEKEASTLINQRLIPLTSKYLTSLHEAARQSKGRGIEAIDSKINAVNQLLKSLSADNSNISNSYRVTNFYSTLNDVESKITFHRDPSWKRFIKGLLIGLSTLVVGLGLAALAAYTKTGDTELKSMKFWQSGGRNVVDALKGMEPDTDKSGPGPSDSTPGPSAG